MTNGSNKRPFNSNGAAVSELYRRIFEFLGQVESLKDHVYIASDILRKYKFEDRDEDVI